MAVLKSDPVKILVSDWIIILAGYKKKYIESRMSSKLGQIQPWTAELAALDQLKKIFYLLENYLKILASS